MLGTPDVLGRIAEMALNSPILIAFVNAELKCRLRSFTDEQA